jgi:hypothetical protein
MLLKAETLPETSGFGDSLVRSPTRFYGGEATQYTPRVDTPALQTIAVCTDDFREDHGNLPKVFHLGGRTRRPAILANGLTDSSGYVEAIGLHFAIHGEGTSVVLPLPPARILLTQKDTLSI